MVGGSSLPEQEAMASECQVEVDRAQVSVVSLFLVQQSAILLQHTISSNLRADQCEGVKNMVDSRANLSSSSYHKDVWRSRRSDHVISYQRYYPTFPVTINLIPFWSEVRSRLFFNLYIKLWNRVGSILMHLRRILI